MLVSVEGAFVVAGIDCVASGVAGWVCAIAGAAKSMAAASVAALPSARVRYFMMFPSESAFGTEG
jgi:hypothetical protein